MSFLAIFSSISQANASDMYNKHKNLFVELREGSTETFMKFGYLKKHPRLRTLVGKTLDGIEKAAPPLAAADEQ